MLQKLLDKTIPELLDKLAMVKGLPVLVGLILVVLSLFANILSLRFLTRGQWLLHVGVITGLGGMLFSDTL